VSPFCLAAPLALAALSWTQMDGSPQENQASGARAHHWTPMTFDGALFCAWLPAPLPETRSVEYYLEAVDDQFEPSRTVDYALEVRSECPPPAQRPPQTPAVVGTTVANQPPSPPGFDPSTFTTR